MNGAAYHNGRSNLRWKLTVLYLWLRHPVWTWKMRRDWPMGAVHVPFHTFGGGDG